MKTLAIETSGRSFGVALSENGTLVCEIFLNAGLFHSEKLIPSIEKLFAFAGWTPKELEKIAVCVGPGSFTGIRVGMACAKTMAQQLGIGLVGKDSLSILKSGVPEGPYEICPLIDALRDEVYVLSRRGISELKTAEEYLNSFKGKKKPLMFVGSGAVKYRELIKKKTGKFAHFAPEAMNDPRAGVLALMAAEEKGSKQEKILPLYIRRSWAEEKRK